MKIGRIILSAVVALGCLLSMAGCGAPKSSVGNIEPMNFVDGDLIAEISIEGYGTIKAKLFPDLAPNGVENFRLLAEQGYYNGLKIHRVYEDNLVQGGSLNGDGTGGKALINTDGKFGLETSEQARHIYGALCYANVNGNNSTQFFIVNNKTTQDLTTYDPEQIRAAAAANTELMETMGDTDPEYSTYSYKASYYTVLADMLTNATPEVKAAYAGAGGLPLFDGGYTVFGQVFEGFDVLDKLNSVEVTVNAYGEKSKPVQDIVISSVTITEFKAGTAESTAEAEPEDKPDDKSTADASTADAGTGERLKQQRPVRSHGSYFLCIKLLPAPQQHQCQRRSKCHDSGRYPCGSADIGQQHQHEIREICRCMNYHRRPKRACPYIHDTQQQSHYGCAKSQRRSACHDVHSTEYHCAHYHRSTLRKALLKSVKHYPAAEKLLRYRRKNEEIHHHHYYAKPRQLFGKM